MSKEWLWDKKTSISEVKKILKDSSHKEFASFASLLLARKNNPQEVFKEYLNPLLFCQQWPKIKKIMRKDKWSNQRIVFWQAIYEKLKDKYRKQGIAFRENKKGVRGAICKKVGEMIQDTRKEKGLSQKALAEKLGVSQQIISRIESGKENLSLITLTNILRIMDKKVDISCTQGHKKKRVPEHQSPEHQLGLDGV